MLSITPSKTIADEVMGALSSDLVTVEVRACSSIFLGLFAANINLAVLSGIFNLTYKQSVSEALLSLSLMTMWAIAFWFGYNRLRRVYKF